MLLPHRRPVGRFPARPSTVAAAMTLAVSLLLTACGGAKTSTPQVFDKTTTPDGALAPITTTSSTLATAKVTYLGQACPFSPDSTNGLRIECGQLIVPMRRDQPTTKQVTLSVAVIKSPSPTPQPDPVIYLAGGPGGSAVAAVDQWTIPPSPILDHRDLILIDQRGTGYSAPRLNCNRIFVESGIKGPNDDRRPEAQECVDQLRFEGVDPSAYNTFESANDIADLRRALKLPTWNLFGISYGTRLALEVMKVDPTGIRSVVLDSVYPSGSATYEAPVSADRAVQAVAADSRGATCVQRCVPQRRRSARPAAQPARGEPGPAPGVRSEHRSLPAGLLRRHGVRPDPLRRALHHRDHPRRPEGHRRGEPG